MQEVMTAAYKTSARVYRQDLSIARLASQGLPFLGVPLACRERGDRDIARLAAGPMPPMTGYWSRRYCSVGAEGEGFEPPDLSVSCFQVTFWQFRRIRPRSPALKNPPAGDSVHSLAFRRNRPGWRSGWRTTSLTISWRSSFIVPAFTLYRQRRPPGHCQRCRNGPARARTTRSLRADHAGPAMPGA